jgi:putative alpha-1,2-mannosidase
MAGDGPDAVIASVYAFGVRDFDALAALTAMDKGASQVGTTSAGQLVRLGLADYLNLGYVSTATSGSASLTLEYATDDFSIAQFARALGDDARYRSYLKRSQNWRLLFHDGYIVPRHSDGRLAAITPTDCCNDFTEGSPARYVWMVPFNLRGPFDAMGGNAAAISRLDEHIQQLNAGPAASMPS